MNKQDNLLKKDKLPWIAFLRAYTVHIQYVTKIIKMLLKNLITIYCSIWSENSSVTISNS